MRLDTIRLWVDAVPREAALNMAVDEVMLRRAASPWLRVYGWARPSVSLGFSQPAALAESSAAGRDVVRRWTGGGVVVHDDDWTYTLAVPASDPVAAATTSESYRWIHECLIAALAECGIEGCELQEVSVSDGMGQCFVEPARHDVLLGGRKVAGAAQRRTQAGLLHQGSLQPLAAPCGLAERLAGRLAREVLRVEQAGAEAALLAEADVLAREKYGDPGWLRERRPAGGSVRG